MANLIPSLDQIDQFPKALEPGERALMNALLEVLDDTWTIYVQPYLNGLQPDIVIFSEHAGLAVFEVKDWNLDSYSVSSTGEWSVYNAKQARWLGNVVRCPLAQVKHYRDSIIRYELPEVDAEIALDQRFTSFVATFVYFHNHTTKEAMIKAAPLQEAYPYVVVFGHDWLNPESLGKVLRQQRLSKDSPFGEFILRSELHNRLRNAMSYPQHGRIDVNDILFDLHKDQRPLLSNTPGKKRVIGSAGSGKSLILARKAVSAAESDQLVLVVCFNITMVNYLNDIIRRLARSKSGEGLDLNQRILIRHYHRMFPYDGDLLDPDVQSLVPFDVLLIDEGQDLSRERILKLYELAHPQRGHVMLMEDDRQNLYNVDTDARRTVPGISGRPNLLKRSFRLNYDIAAVANRLIALSQRKFESGELESAKPRQTGLFRPVWCDGVPATLLPAMANELKRLVESSDTGALSDVVILVCSRYDGWEVCDHLDTLNLPYICNFESRSEHQIVQKMGGDQPTREMRLRELNRGRKLAFRMQTGRIKVCTIHSFKGWELQRAFIYFTPPEKQFENRVPLLYTAITRAQEWLHVFNAERTLLRFGEIAATEGLLTLQILEPTPEDARLSK